MFSLSSGLCLPVFHLLVFALAATHREKGREENSVNSKSGYGAVQTLLFLSQSVSQSVARVLHTNYQIKQNFILVYFSSLFYCQVALSWSADCTIK